MTRPPTSPRLFDLRLSEAPDALLRVLNLFVVQGAQVEMLGLHRTSAGAHLRVELADLAEERFDRLLGHLSSSMFVLGVGHTPEP